MGAYTWKVNRKLVTSTWLWDLNEPSSEALVTLGRLVIVTRIKLFAPCPHVKWGCGLWWAVWAGPVSSHSTMIVSIHFKISNIKHIPNFQQQPRGNLVWRFSYYSTKNIERKGKYSQCQWMSDCVDIGQWQFKINCSNLDTSGHSSRKG